MYLYSYIYEFLLLCLYFLLLYMFCSVYSISFCCPVYCLCVNVYCTTATGCQPNCSQQIYHIISYIIYRIISYIISYNISYIISYIVICHISYNILYYISYLQEPGWYCRYTSIVAKNSFS